MLPLALAGPLLVPLLDRAGPRRAISFAAAAGRAVVAIYAAPRVGTLLLFPGALMMLVLSKVHAITKNGLTMAYAPPDEGLMRANARLGRIAVAGVIAVFPLGYVFLKVWGATGPIYLAAVVYAHLGAPEPPAAAPTRQAARRSPTSGGAGGSRSSPAPRSARRGCARRAGSCCSSWRSRSGAVAEPAVWFGVLAAAGVAGGFLADISAPRLPTDTREEAVVIACVSAACDRRVARVRGVRAPSAHGLRASSRGRRPSSAGSRSRA